MNLDSSKAPRRPPCGCSCGSYYALNCQTPGARAQGTVQAVTWAILQEQVPDGAPGVGVHPRGGLIQDDHLGVSHEGNGDGQLPLHATCGYRAGRGSRGLWGTGWERPGAGGTFAPQWCDTTSLDVYAAFKPWRCTDLFQCRKAVSAS